MVKRPRLLSSMRLLLPVILLVLLSYIPPAKLQAQDLSDLIAITVDPGFDSYFRQDDWIPLKIDVSNDGSDFVGRLAVRPETSGSGLTSTFSTPISLPSGSRKSAFLYVQALSFTQRVRVELLDENELVYASTEVPLRTVQSTDNLYVIVTESPIGSLDMTNVVAAGYRAFQANWLIPNIPERSPALDAIDVMMFSDVDTGAFTPAQADAIADWVANGGHLIVTGGSNWQGTAAGFENLLPFQPSDSQIVDDVNGFADIAGRGGTLEEPTVIAVGEVAREAETLAITSDGLPLMVRGVYGAGTVDYITADPTSQFLLRWGGLDDVWFTLLSSVSPRASWNFGFRDWDQAINSIEILPGVNLLPEVFALCSFLGLYIALVGPINYLILNRINRREWAWVTIPGLIILFSVMSWTFGFNLRGSEAIVSRLSVVQSWPTAERARVDQLVGLLSPLRATYSLAVTDDRLMHSISRSIVAGIFGSAGIKTDTDIRQTEIFRANEFPVDASFVASFNASGTTEKPQISGSATLSFEEDGRLQQIQGSVRNDSEQTLFDPIILTRGVTFMLNEPLEPGDLKTFEEILGNADALHPQPAAFEPSLNIGTSALGFRYASRIDRSISAREVLGFDTVRALESNNPFPDTATEQETNRRWLFLQSMMVDRFNSTGRGNKAYLTGWVEQAPSDFEVEGANWTTKDTTLYIIELDLTLEEPLSSQEVVLTVDQFTWTTQQRFGVANYTGPLGMRLVPGDDIVFRYTPLPGLVLSEVSELRVSVGSSTAFARRVPLQIWDWENETWTLIEMTDRQTLIPNHEAFIGPQNAVQLRLFLEGAGGYVDVGDLAIEQKGRF